MRRFICGLMTAALAVSLLALPASAVEFSDIQGHWGESAIEQVAQWGLFAGTGNQQFSPDATMTRGMFVTVTERTAKLFQVYQEPVGAQSFVDVPADTWYTQAVAWASENDIVNGIGGGKFAPEVPVTREQMCVIMVRFLSACTDLDLTVYAQGGNSFLDGDTISDYAVDSVNVCVALGLIAGVPAAGGLEFQPQMPASRAAVAVVLQRLVSAVQQSGGGVVVPPATQEPAEGEKAEEAKAAECIQYIIQECQSSDYLPTTDPAVQDCMAILVGCMQDALVQRQNGQFLDRDFIQAHYASQIQQLRTAYGNLTKDQRSDFNLVIAYLDSEQLDFVLDYFGVSMGV